MKRIIDNLLTLMVFFDVISLPFLYYGFYKLMYNPDEPHFHQIITIILIICHVTTAKALYDKLKKDRQKGEKEE